MIIAGEEHTKVSEDTDLVTELGGAAVRGYQSANINNPNSVPHAPNILLAMEVYHLEQV